MSERFQGLVRRSFLTRIGTGLTALGATLGGSALTAQAQATGSEPGGWQPSRHALDDWYDQPGSKHRMFFDTISAPGFGQALRFAGNFIGANSDGYAVNATDLALIVCARHQSTALAFNDAMWAKYGAGLGERAHFVDPKTKQPPAKNPFTSIGMGLDDDGDTIISLARRGVRFAVCQLASHGCAATIARKTGGDAAAIYTEITSNMIPNAHLVPAGIVAVNRAQERGYTFAYVG